MSRLASRAFLIGQIMKKGVNAPNTFEIKIMSMELDTYLTKYYYKATNVLAVDQKNLGGKIGDLVLLKKLPGKYTEEIEHEFSQIVFKEGVTTDPITGRRCRGRSYIDSEFREKVQHKLISAVEES